MIPIGVAAMIFVVFGMFAVMLVAAVSKYAPRGGVPGSPADAREIGERLRRIEHMLEIVTQEVEMVSEGQRFLSNRLKQEGDRIP